MGSAQGGIFAAGLSLERRCSPCLLGSAAEENTGLKGLGEVGGMCRDCCVPGLQPSSPPAAGNQRHQQAEEWGTPVRRADPEMGG